MPPVAASGKKGNTRQAGPEDPLFGSYPSRASCIIAIDNLPGKFYVSRQAMNKETNKTIWKYLSEIARKGGKARAEKYNKATLSMWAKKGGRPPKKGKKS